MEFPLKNRQDFYNYYKINLISPSNKIPIFQKLDTFKFKRCIPLDELKALEDSHGNKFCGWCATYLKPPVHRLRKYCSEECSQSAYWFCYPAKAHIPLLFKQDFKCNICKFDYLPFVFKIIKENFGIKRYKTLNFDDNGMMKIQFVIESKEFITYLENKKIEIDHIIPVKLAGYTFGFSNIQLICRECHLAKTKIDRKFISLEKKKT